MRVYGLTKLGRKVVSTKDGGDDDLRAMQYIRENKTATSGELDVIVDRYVIRRLKNQGLVQELTS